MSESGSSPGMLGGGDIASSAPSPKQRQSSLPLLLLLLLSLLVGLAARIMVGWDAPLWLDEAFTGAIALQPSFAGLVRDCLHELGGPVYYGFMWSWEKLFGAGKISLRLPSLIFAILAPLTILLAAPNDRTTRWIWASVTALWVPSFFYASEARAYTLLLFLATAQLVCFQRLMRRPDLRTALACCGVTVLFILTHYHALLVTAFLGLSYLAVHGRTALRTWPAALLFLIPAAWMSVHLPLHFRFSDADVAWQTLLVPRDAFVLPELIFGPRLLALALSFAIAATLLRDFYRRVRMGSPLPFETIDILTVAASLAAILIVFGIGFIRPSFTDRYLMAFIPGMLYGLAVWARTWGERWRPLPALVIGGFIIASVFTLASRVRDPGYDFRRVWSWEQASADLMKAGPRRLFFTWDNPTAALVDRSQMNRVASFFFNREGVRIPTVAVAAAGDVDLNRAFLAVADRPGDAIIWVYDLKVRNTRALVHPPRIGEIDPRWSCRDYGSGKIGIIACLRGA